MKPEEALDVLKRMRVALATSRVDGIRVLEPLNVAIAATEKQVAKKPTVSEGGDDGEHYDYCPICDKSATDNYCGNCGHKLDWGSEE
ncbi:hypothetical protein [Proteiniclasticum ruminis]|uniref:Uncharacterized protein n=1 Tax=Proteiniclasticum ruminis TaxID=398199 RepID=A0A1I4ZLQ9_9CLOT|nr:hypothetical protein [Proteiniclasticum ruminis]SFN50900.1 hypothetical protein SAMN04488695_10238 [Proteiniclasticum ruminis]